MDNRLSIKYGFWSLLKFSTPTIIMMVFMSLYTMVDGVFVSRLLGTDALSAINIVYPIVSVVIAIGIMLATGGSAIVARKMGEGKPAEAKQDFSLIVVAGIIIGAVFSFFCALFLEPILLFLGADASIYALCRAYAIPLVLFTIPAILQMLFQNFFVTSGRPGIGLAVTLVGGIANIILDYVFIGILHWGIAGAAVATGIGYSIPAVYGMVWFLVNKKATLSLVAPVWRRDTLTQALANGSSEMVTNLSTAVITYLFNIMMMGYLKADGVAAITIVLYAEYLLTAVYLGFSTGIAPVVSYNHGEGNTKQLKKIFRISLYFIGFGTAATFLGANIFAKNIVGVFAPAGSPVFSLAVHGFYLYAYCFLFKGINIFASSLFTALSDGKTSAILSFMRTLVFIIAGMLILPLYFGVDGVWLAVPFAETLSVFLSFGCFYRQFTVKWGKKGRVFEK